LIAAAVRMTCVRRVEHVAAECFSRNAGPDPASAEALLRVSAGCGKTAAHRSASVSVIQHCPTRMMG